MNYRYGIVLCISRVIRFPLQTLLPDNRTALDGIPLAVIIPRHSILGVSGTPFNFGTSYVDKY